MKRLLYRRFDQTRRPLRLAHGGTILLDEISEISPNVQATAARSAGSANLSAWAATAPIQSGCPRHRHYQPQPEPASKRKNFARTLFRLNVVPIHVPRCASASKTCPFSATIHAPPQPQARCPGKGFSDEAMIALKKPQLARHVRRTPNVIERAVILCGENGCLEPEHLGLTPSRKLVSSPPADSSPPPLSLAATLCAAC